jgi:GAF domain-containing protein
VETNDEIGTLAKTFNAMTAELQDTLLGLERRVANRTQELKLAGEVGRSLAQQRDLDLLLKKAAELIRDRFDLYYTQIYLVDPEGRVLQLRAGTGEAGAELLRRKHRLLLNTESINGSCASERRPVIVEDTSVSSIFRQNPLLPDTRSELAVPLMSGDHVVGVLDMQSSQTSAFSVANLDAFQALAGQLAIAIENAKLFAQAQQARAEAERQIKLQTKEGWKEFLDAVNRPERISSVYEEETQLEQSTLDPANSDMQPLSVDLQIMGEKVGMMQLERGGDQTWTDEESDLASSVANLVVRQIDGMRLLAQSQQYRAEAEEAVQRMIRQGWENYQGIAGLSGFAYDQVQVTPITGSEGSGNGQQIRSPLIVGGETIGELIIGGEVTPDEDEQSFLQTIAERLSNHVENLRLSDQTRAALTETSALYEGSARILSAGNLQDVLMAIVESTSIHNTDRSVMDLFDKPWISDPPTTLSVAAVWEKSGAAPLETVGTIYQVSEQPYLNMLNRDVPTIIEDVSSDDRLDENTRALCAELGVNGLLIFPLVVGGQWIGFVTAETKESLGLNESELKQIGVLVDQAAAVVQNMLLYKNAQMHARQEQRIREVTAQVFSASDIDTILRRTVEQVGRVLGVPAYIYLGEESRRTE